MMEILPIAHLINGLAPSLVVGGIALCAFTHANWAMHAKPLSLGMLYNSFSLLITSDLPEETLTPPVLMFSCLAVGFFSVFFLNIFIGVIGESYNSEKSVASLSVLKKKCSLCLNFLLRARVIPSRLLSRTATEIILYTSLTIGVAFGIAELSNMKAFTHPEPAWIAVQVLALLACYQDPEEAWTRSKGNDSRFPRHLWVAAVDNPEEESMEDMLDRFQYKVQEFREASN